jgi:endonuclease YncB( thermonuclease family)
VRVEGDKKDRYGRIVGKVWVATPDCPSCAMTLDAGRAQITMGRAWWFRRYANEQSPEDRKRYESAEREARVKKVGLWQDSTPVPP